MAFQVNDAEFRRIEREILDPLHETLALFARDRADARLGLLAAFDGIVLPSAIATMMGREPNASTRQVEKKFEDGLAQAIRWLTVPGDEPLVSSKLAPGLLDDAGNFLIHAGDYANLVDFHRLYGAGMVLAEVDAQHNRIRFTHPTRERGFEAAMGFISSADHELARLNDAVKQAKIQPRKPIKYDLRDGMVRLQHPELLATNDPDFELPEPPKAIHESADLDGFTMAEFTAFWRQLVHWSAHCVVIYAQLALAGKKQELCMPTQVIQVEEFRDALVKLSALSAEKVALILNRLSFDYRTKSPCIFQQPLLVGGGNVAWSPNLIIHSRYDRNMLRLMARTPGLKRLADNLIGGRERILLNQFGQRLQRLGWAYKLSQQIQHYGERGEVDLLGYTRNQRNAVAIVEWKSILTVDEVHEVRAATAELVSGQAQAVKCVGILRKMSKSDKSALYPFVPWDNITEYVPLVVTKDVDPNETFDHAQVPCVCVDSLIAFGRASDARSPIRLAEFARGRPWHRKYAHLKEEFEELKVGEATYELPMLVKPLQ